LCSIIFCCSFVNAQVSLYTSYTNISSGQTITVYGSGEIDNVSNVDYISGGLPSVSSMSTTSPGANYQSYITVTPVGNVSFFNTVTNSATHFEITVTNSNTQSAITVTINFDVVITNTVNGSGNNGTLALTLTVQPSPSSYPNQQQTGPWYTSCSTGDYGLSVPYTVPAGQYSASTQAAANQLAYNAGQAYANTHGSCTVLPTPTVTFNSAGSISNYTVPVTFSIGVPTSACNSTTLTAVDQLGGGLPNIMVTATNPLSATLSLTTGHTYTITATCDGPGYANNVNSVPINYTAPGTAPIYSNVAASANFTRNNCTVGTGSTVTYTVNAGTYTSQISQANADAQAQANISANGQNYANANGVCPISYTYNVLTKGSSSSYFSLTVNGTNVSGGSVQTASYNTEKAITYNTTPNANSIVILTIDQGYMPTSATLGTYLTNVMGIISGRTITFSGVNISTKQASLNITLN
jgi:hypothetical protein